MYALSPSATTVPSIASSSLAVACGLPPPVHNPMSPAPTRTSGGNTTAGVVTPGDSAAIGANCEDGTADGPVVVDPH
jgi:hypothetical protein